MVSTARDNTNGPNAGPAIMVRDPSTARRRALVALGCAVAWIASDLWLRPGALAGTHFLPWYPGAGLGLGLLILGEPWAIPVFFGIRVLLGHLPPVYPAPWPAGLVEAALLTAVYAVAARFIRRRVDTEGGGWRIKDAAWLCGAIAVAAVGAGFVAAYGASVWRAQPWGNFAANVVSFAAGDAAGAVVALPLILFVLLPVARGRHDRDAETRYHGSPDDAAQIWTHARWVEHLGQVAVVALTLLALWSARADSLVAGYLCFVPLMWIALREGIPGVAIATAVYGLAFGAIGTFVQGVPGSVLQTQLFILTLGSTGLFLGAARSAVMEGEARYWHLVATANEGIWRVGADNRTLYANRRMGEILGIDAAALLGRRAVDFLAPEDRERWTALNAERVKGRSSSYEVDLVRADGGRVTVMVTGSPVRSATSGAVIGAVAVVTDVTALRKAEREQRFATVLLETAFRNSRDAMILFRAGDEMIVDVNDIWCATTGYSREQVIGKSQKTLDIWDDPRDGERLAQEIAERGSAVDFEFSFWRRLPSGKKQLGWAVLNAHPVTIDGTTYFLVVGRDVTEAREAERQRNQLQRLEELGRLAGGIAHDFNNLLTIVRIYAQVVRAAIREHRMPLEADITEIEAATERGSGLTRRLLAFSRHQPVEPKLVNLNRVVREAEALLRPVAGGDIELAYELGDDVPDIMADAGQLDQILLNLAINARDAMPSGGRITIRTRRTVMADSDARFLGPDAKSGVYAVLEVADTGLGMDEATRARVFEPFFTTKEQGKGTGLGLAVVYGIARQSRGFVLVDSAPGEGAMFTILWPAADSPSRTPVQQQPATPSRDATDVATSQRVLLVEDEVSVRTITRRLLEHAGYRVTEAADGHEALERCAEMAADSEPPDVVLSDVTMPRMGGRALAERLGVAYPGIPVLLMSGHVGRDNPLDGLTNVPLSVLAKPFTAADLLKSIRETARTGTKSPTIRS